MLGRLGRCGDGEPVSLVSGIKSCNSSVGTGVVFLGGVVVAADGPEVGDPVVGVVVALSGEVWPVHMRLGSKGM